MTGYFFDTSVLGRLANINDQHHAMALSAIAQLHRAGAQFHLAPQNLVEFRNVATRPRAVNGLGLTIPETETKAAEFERLMQIVPETPAIYPAWKHLVMTAGVIGKQVHDARLFVICALAGISHLLTFNIQHFVRLTPFGPGPIIVHPKDV